MKGDLQFGLILLLVVALLTLPRTIRTSNWVGPAVASPSGETLVHETSPVPALPAQIAAPPTASAQQAKEPVLPEPPAPSALTDISPDGYAGTRPNAGPVLGNVPTTTRRPTSADRNADDAIRHTPDEPADVGRSAERPTERETAPSPPKGPIHPFFQRYLDRGEYFVRDGDTLRDIALRLYQDESMVPELLRINRSLLATADDLRPGMMLRLPH
jgi:nucleoid-associated protein YgaU